MKEIYTKYTGKGGYDREIEEAAKIFDPEKQYKIVGGYIGDCRSCFEFEGIKGLFNTVMFDTPWEDAQHLMEHSYRNYQ